MNKKNLLSKAEMKKILGGNELPASCNTSCNSGYYACCNDVIVFEGKGGASCLCRANDTTHECESGGAGSNYCSINE